MFEFNRSSNKLLKEIIKVYKGWNFFEINKSKLL